MATSFPFLKIARERNIPYGEVIRMVQEIEEWGMPNATCWKLYDLDALCDAMEEENQRRFIVEQCK